MRNHEIRFNIKVGRHIPSSEELEFHTLLLISPHLGLSQLFTRITTRLKYKIPFVIYRYTWTGHCWWNHPDRDFQMLDLYTLKGMEVFYWRLGKDHRYLEFPMFINIALPPKPPLDLSRLTHHCGLSIGVLIWSSKIDNRTCLFKQETTQHGQWEHKQWQYDNRRARAKLHY